MFNWLAKSDQSEGHIYWRERRVYVVVIVSLNCRKTFVVTIIDAVMIGKKEY